MSAYDPKRTFAAGTVRAFGLARRAARQAHRENRAFARLARYDPRRGLAPATGDSVLGLDLDWPARVAEVAPHFVAHSSTNFVVIRVE